MSLIALCHTVFFVVSLKNDKVSFMESPELKNSL